MVSSISSLEPALIVEVPICIEDIPVFTGRFGTANGNNVVKITRTHPPGTQPQRRTDPQDLPA